MAFQVGDIEGRLTLDRSPYTEGLRIAREQADRFEGNKITPLVDVDTAKADAELATTKAELTRLDHTRATPTVVVNTRDSQRGMGLLATSIIALGPAAIAAGGIAAGALAPLALGLAGVAAVAIPLVKELSKGKGPAEAVAAFQSMMAAWHSFQAAVSPAVVGLLGNVFGLISATLPALVPLVTGTAHAFSLLVAGLIPLAPAFGRAFTAMLPIVNLITQGVLHLAQSLAQWTQGRGFQQFVAYIVQNGPLLAHTFGDLVRLLVQLGIAAAPLLPVLLRITSVLAQMLTALLRIPGVGPAIVTLAAFAVVALKVGSALSGLPTKLAAAERGLLMLRPAFLAVGRAAMALFANPVGLAIAAVVVGTILIIQHWDQVKKALSAVWNFLKNAASTAFGLVKKAAEVGLLGPIPFIIAHWNQFKDTLAGIWKWIENAAQNAGAAMIKAFVNGIKSVALAPVNAVKSVLGKARDLLPFSEPKDASSPLHGLHRSGAAIVKNLLTGFHQASPGLRAALHSALGRNLLIPELGAGRNIAWAGPQGSGITGSTFYGDTHVNVHTARGHYPHGKAAAMDIADEMRRTVRRQK